MKEQLRFVVAPLLSAISAILLLMFILTGCTANKDTYTVAKVIVPQLSMEDWPKEVWLIFALGEHVDSLNMNFSQNHGLYTIPTRDVVQKITQRTDSLEVAFTIVSQDGGLIRDAFRHVPVSHFVNLQPLFTFNESYAPSRNQRVSFMVNMANQQVLGFFDPNRGDRVFVHGNFHKWPAQGISLEIDTSGMHRLETEIGYFEGDDLTYYYRIVPGEDVYLPNSGREVVYRFPSIGVERIDWFNEHKRIARFSIRKNNVDHTERTYIGVWIDGRIAQSDELVHVEGDLLETAFALPEGLDNIQWAVIDAHKNPLTDLHQLDIDDNGVWIKM